MQNENISLTTLDPMPHFYCSSGWFLVALTLMQSLELPILHTHETQIRNRQWLVRQVGRKCSQLDRLEKKVSALPIEKKVFYIVLEN